MLSIGYLKGAHMHMEELAQKIDGLEYRTEISPELLQEARDNNLVIVHGASDDLIEFYGAITDEGDCYDGGNIQFDKKGILPSRETAEEFGYDDCVKHYLRTQNCWNIKAVWCAPDSPAWTYIFGRGCLTFEIIEGDEVYCRGIVFSIEDL